MPERSRNGSEIFEKALFPYGEAKSHFPTSPLHPGVMSGNLQAGSQKWVSKFSKIEGVGGRGGLPTSGLIHAWNPPKAKKYAKVSKKVRILKSCQSDEVVWEYLRFSKHAKNTKFKLKKAFSNTVEKSGKNFSKNAHFPRINPSRGVMGIPVATEVFPVPAYVLCWNSSPSQH